MHLFNLGHEIKLALVAKGQRAINVLSVTAIVVPLCLDIVNSAWHSGSE